MNYYLKSNMVLQDKQRGKWGEKTCIELWTPDL